MNLLLNHVSRITLDICTGKASVSVWRAVTVINTEFIVYRGYDCELIN